MTKRILTIGGGMLDIFLRYQHNTLPCTHEKNASYLLLEVGRKIELSHIERHSGGGATNSAVSFSRLGFDVHTCCKVGNDCEGEYILNALAQEQVNTSNIATTDTMTGTSIIIPCPEGDRTVLLYRGASLLLEKKDLPLQQIASSEQLYITSLSHQAAHLLSSIVRQAQKYDIPIAINPGTSQMLEHAESLRTVLPALDILILNAFESKICMKSIITKHEISTKPEICNNDQPSLLHKKLSYSGIEFYIRDYFATVLKHGPRIAVVTDGAHGVYVAHKNTIYYHPSLDVDVVSTLGAGDAFGSCFVANLAQGKSIPEALIRGITQASSVIQYLDAKTGLLNTQELEKKASTLGKSNIKTYCL